MTEPECDPAPVDRDHRDAVAARHGRGRGWPRSSRRWRRPTTACSPSRRRCARPIRGRRSRPTTVELPEADGRAVTVRVSGIAKGVGMIHPQMATMLSVILTDATVGARGPVATAPAGRGADLGPALGRRRHQHERHRLRPRVRGGGGRARPRTARRPLPRSDAAIEAIARDLARQQAADGEGASDADHGRGHRARATTPRRGPWPVRSSRRAWSRRRPTAATRTGVASRARPATRGWPIASVLEAAGLPAAEAAARAGTPVVLDPAKLRISIAGHLVFDGAQGGPVAFDRAAARAAMNDAEVVIALDLGLGAGQWRGASAAT